jgi:hypothetical protein
MKSNYENVFYAPKLSNRATISVRRLSWFMGKPMTQAINSIIEILPYMVDAEKVCLSCQIKDKCNYCAFNNPKRKPDEQNQ